MGFFKRKQRNILRKVLEETAQISLKTIRSIDKKLKNIPGFTEQQADSAYEYFDSQREHLLYHDKSEVSLKLANKYKTKIDIAYKKATGHTYKRKTKGKTHAASLLLIGASAGYLMSNVIITGQVISTTTIIQQNSTMLIPLFLLILGLLLLKLNK